MTAPPTSDSTRDPDALAPDVTDFVELACTNVLRLYWNQGMHDAHQSYKDGNVNRNG